MAEVTWLVYATDEGTATARPVKRWEYGSEATAPDLSDEPNRGAVKVYSFDIDISASPDQKNLITVNPSTGAYVVVPVNAMTIEQRQTVMLGQIKDLIVEWEWTQRPDAKITVATRDLFKTYIDTLNNIPTAQAATWASNPEGVTIPATPAVTTSSVDIAYQMAKLMGDNTISVRTTFLSDRETRLPEFLFDDQDSSLFSFAANSALAFGGTITDGKSGGAGGLFTQLVAGTAAVMQGLPVNYTSVREGDRYTWEIDCCNWAASLAPAALELYVMWFQADKTPVAATPETLVATLDLQPNPNFTQTAGQVVAPTGARWATFKLRLPANGGTVMRAKIDGVTLRRTLGAKELEPKAVTLPVMADMNPGVLGRAAGSGLGTPQRLLKDDLEDIILTRQVTLGPFFVNDVPASANTPATLGFFNTATALSRAISDVKMAQSGRILGGIIVSDAARTAGNILIRPRINGSPVIFPGGACAVDATNVNGNLVMLTETQADLLAFAAGDTVGVAALSASFAPTTANLELYLILELDV